MNNIHELYYEWLLNHTFTSVMNKHRHEYNKLMHYLFETPFYWSIPRDANRYEDALELRDRFLDLMDDDNIEVDQYFGTMDVSVLEVMAALAIRCEETIMSDSRYGDRTGEWFWEMLTSMELQTQTDDCFNRHYVHNAVTKMLNREYSPNGIGGLFTIPGCDHDLRTVEIWYQMVWFMSYISKGE